MKTKDRTIEKEILIVFTIDRKMISFECHDDHLDYFLLTQQRNIFLNKEMYLYSTNISIHLMKLTFCPSLIFRYNCNKRRKKRMK
jgi:hypothetical protein